MIFTKDRSKQIAAVFISSFISLPVFAYSNGYIGDSLHSYMAAFLPPNASLSLQLGGFDADQGRAQDIGIQGLVGDHFSVTRHHDQNVVVGLGYYINGLSCNNYHLNYGLNAFYLAPTRVRGDVVQEQLFTNLSYRYSITNYPIYFMAQGLVNVWDNRVALIADVGIGPNVIQARNFKESSLDGGITIPDHPFSENSEVAFSATAGLGLRFNHLIDCIPVDVSYRFFYLGEGHLKNSTNQILNHFKTGESYANALIVSISI